MLLFPLIDISQYYVCNGQGVIQSDGLLRQLKSPLQGLRATTPYSVDHGREVHQKGIAHCLDDVAVMFGDGLLSDLIVNFQHPQHAGLIRAHLAAEAHDVGEHDGGQFAGLGLSRVAGVFLHGGDYAALPSGLSNRPRGKAVPTLHFWQTMPLWHYPSDMLASPRNKGGNAMALPLAGIRVLDIASMLAGPYGATMLGDMGADVIKIEPPYGDESRAIGVKVENDSGFFIGINRNKRGLVLDLPSPKAKKSIFAW